MSFTVKTRKEISDELAARTASLIAKQRERKELADRQRKEREQLIKSQKA